ncbi:conserved hypothetical protein [delta proteobacterium NaphS2]|nr:conserved hypothetical protein [delta proteobacterium NaphS2]
MNWLIVIVPAVWAVWTWAHEHKKERMASRHQMVALYVYPFLSACEDLQSRIFNILELNGLRVLRKRYPDASYADETLYLIVRYFGWVAAMHRYGTHAHDPEVIRLTEAVHNAFATPQHPLGPFNFFRPEQKALGKLVMHRFEGQYGVELDTIPYYTFRKELTLPPMADSEAVNQTLTALKKATHAKNLAGRYRLAETQNHLVDLLEYLEEKEGISLFPGKRSKCKTSDVNRKLT